MWIVRLAAFENFSEYGQKDYYFEKREQAKFFSEGVFKLIKDMKTTEIKLFYSKEIFTSDPEKELKKLTESLTESQ